MTAKRTDQQACIDAVREVLSEYIDAGVPHDAVAAVEQLLEALDNRAVDSATKRIDGRNHFDVVTINN